LVLDDGKTIGVVARDLDLTPSALRLWVRRAQADRTHGRTGLTTAEREELARLRKENRELRTDRDILKKTAAFFGKPSRKVWLDCRGEGRAHGPGVLSRPGGVAERVLRLAPAPGVGARHARSPAARLDPRVA